MYKSITDVVLKFSQSLTGKYEAHIIINCDEECDINITFEFDDGAITLNHFISKVWVLKILDSDEYLQEILIDQILRKIEQDIKEKILKYYVH